jgi:hypothetical protein
MATKEKINKQVGVRVKGSEYLEIEDGFGRFSRDDYKNKNDFLREALLLGCRQIVKAKLLGKLGK